MAEFSYYCGIEGGATCTKCILVKSDGTVLAKSEGGGTNQFLIGLGECLKRIKTLVEECKKEANLPSDTTLEGLGMSLSGVDDAIMERTMRETVMRDYPGLVKHIYVCNDTESNVAAALPNGGVVLIAGTGSNCQLFNPDGSTARCGGWGHLIGDEASACWISLRAVKVFYDHEDKFRASPSGFPVDAVRDVIFKYFNIKDRPSILDHLYTNFHKPTFSGLCKELAQMAISTRDPLCCEIFEDAGQYLARHLYGVSSEIHTTLKEREGGLPVVCVGSVFKSFDLMEPGFVKAMESFKEQSGITEVSLLSLNVEASLGAAALGAKAAGKVLPIDYSKSAICFYNRKFK